MQKLIACIAILCSSITICGLATTYRQPPDLQVSYYDLTSKARAQVDCLADNVFFEARNEPVSGQKAVAIVTMNRVGNNNFPTSVCGVVRQIEHSTCQFSWWCNDSMRAKALHRNYSGREREMYDTIREVALNVYLNHSRIKDITYGALYYHAVYVDKRNLGMTNIEKTAQIGQHIFYRNKS